MNDQPLKVKSGDLVWLSFGDERLRGTVNIANYADDLVLVRLDHKRMSEDLYVASVWWMEAA